MIPSTTDNSVTLVRLPDGRELEVTCVVLEGEDVHYLQNPLPIKALLRGLMSLNKRESAD